MIYNLMDAEPGRVEGLKSRQIAIKVSFFSVLSLTRYKALQ